MNTLQKIACAAIESLGGGGGIHKFFDLQIELMPDYERSLLANKLCAVMPELTSKFQKMGRYEAWWLTRLSEHNWYQKIQTGVLLQACRDGVNDSNVTHQKLVRNLHNVLNKCVPGWEEVSKWEADGDGSTGKDVEYYMLGELADRRVTFLGLYPNATWPEVDDEELDRREATEAVERQADLILRFGTGPVPEGARGKPKAY